MPDSSTPPDGTQSYVSEIAPITEQIGRNVLAALQSGQVVAVLTTVVPGMGRDRVVSLPLSSEQMAAVQQLLAQVQDPAQADPDRCIGFACEPLPTSPQAAPAAPESAPRDDSE